MNAESAAEDTPKVPKPAPDEPVDIAEFERMTATPSGDPPGGTHRPAGAGSARERFQMGFGRPPEVPAAVPVPPPLAPSAPGFAPAPPAMPAPLAPSAAGAPPVGPPPAAPRPPTFADRSGASLRDARLAATPAAPPAPAAAPPPFDSTRAGTATAEPAGGTSMTGPVGKRRSPVAVVVLSLLTLGIYRMLWHSKINREASDFDFGIDVHPGQSAVALAVPWFLALAVTVLGAIRVAIHLAHVSLSFDPVISTFQGALLLPAVLLVPVLEVLLPFSVVALVMTLERVRLVEARSGLPTDEQVRPSSLVWVGLVPLIGGFILIARIQSRLNAAWDRAASRGLGAGWGSNYGR